MATCSVCLVEMRAGLVLSIIHDMQRHAVMASALTGSLVPMFTAFHTLPYVPSPSCFVTLYLKVNHANV